MHNSEQVKVSVIAATYNGKGYIQRCVDSVLGQTLADFELIIVDDASNDGTWELLRERYGSDPRIRLIRHESNQGVSGARNTGLRAARGSYIAVVDHDDFMEPEYLEVLCNAAEKYQTDYVLCGVRTLFPDGHTDTLFSKTEDIPGGMPCIRYACGLFSNLATWGKIISRRLIEEHDLRYMPGGIEDVYFNFRAMYYCRRYISIPDLLYNKYEHLDSLARCGLSRRYNYVKTFCEVMDRAYDIVEEIRAREPLSWEDEDSIYEFFLTVSLLNIRPLFHTGTRKELFDAFAEYLPERFGKDVHYVRTLMLMNTKAEVRNARLKHENQQLIEQLKALKST